MLRSLSIRDFVIVDRLELEFQPGFTVLTGETGAGKSILIDALSMVLGERADAIVVRGGAERAEIVAEFGITGNDALARWLEAADLAGDDDGLILRRVIEAAGRSRAFINGRPATLAQLREAGERLLNIHGQHEHQSLLRPAEQRDLLDAYGGLLEPAERVDARYRAWQQCRERRLAFETNAASFAAEREQLEWKVRELSALKLGAEEWPALKAEHSRLAHAAALIEAAQSGAEALYEDDGSSLARLDAVVARLGNLVEHDPRLRDILDLLEPARIQLQEAAHALRRYAERQDLDPARLREIEQRLDAIQSAARKYRVAADDLPATLAEATGRLREMGEGGDVDAFREQEESARAAYAEAAAQLSAGRRKAAKKLSAQVTEAMQTLAMEGGTFVASLEPLTEPTAHGLENVGFLVSAHKATAPQPLAKVASGGELSRLSLAIQTVATRVARVPTLVFDEVDAGIGGRAAEIVGNLLKQLGRSHQVMCITHLPQVAATAHQQWQVSKSTANGKVLSRVAVLDRSQRVDEIARMLGGVKITETTRKHAAEMLKGRDQ